MNETGRTPHQSHRETVERHYDRVRQSGVPAEPARRLAEQAADRNHRQWDRTKRDK